MSTTLTQPERPAGDAPRPPVVSVVVPARSWHHDLRAIKVVWQREMIRFLSDRLRIVTVLIQPALYLFVLGSGLSSITRLGSGGGASPFNFRTFIFPGALCMTVLFTAMFSAGSIVWDREFGFLREMLVAPVSRGALVVGKCLGGATVAGFQGLLVLLLCGLVGVPYSPLLLLTVLGELLLLAFTLTAFGVMMAARIQQFQAFMALNQMLLMPLFFLSGSLYPLSRLAPWLRFLTRINPVTYGVDPVRRAVFAHLTVPAVIRRTYNPGVTWDGWKVPVGVELLIVAALGLIMLSIAMVEFRRAE
jgi:ABC-2 type transport system permease protein